MEHQEQAHFQVQEHEGKDAMSTRIFEETTLRIYFPMKPEVTATILSTFSLIPSMVTTFDSHGKNNDIKKNQGCYYTPTTSYIRLLPIQHY